MMDHIDFRPLVTGGARLGHPLTPQVDRLPAAGDVSFSVRDKFSTFDKLKEAISSVCDQLRPAIKTSLKE